MAITTTSAQAPINERLALVNERLARVLVQLDLLESVSPGPAGLSAATGADQGVDFLATALEAQAETLVGRVESIIFRIGRL